MKDDLAVVLLVPGRRNVALIERMLDGVEVEHETVSDIEDLVARIEEGCGPVVLSAKLVTGRVDRLREVLEAQDDWSDVPLILFSSQRLAISSRLAPLIERGNTTLLRGPVQSATFVTVVRAALADRKRQYAVRSLLEDLEWLNRHNKHRIVQLQRLTFQLSRAEERERRRLASMLHDDLQQQLVGAQYRLNVLERRVHGGRAADEPLAELREQLSQAIERSRTLSHELSPPPLRRQSLAEALRWLAGRMQHAHGLEVEVTGDIGDSLEPEDLEILAYRAVQELLFNVVKHADTDRARVDLAREGDTLRVIVRDEGCGFTVEHLDQNQDEDAGLGLFSIRERAYVLGGELEIESRPGAGCTCTLRLPMHPTLDASPHAVNPTPDDERRAILSGGDRDATIRVLVVDDHRYLREGVKALLAEEVDLEVVGEAENGREALEAVRHHHPDVVLLDVSMPVMDGIEAARRLRRDHPQLRIVGLSTFDRDEMGPLMREAGADAYLCKSVPGTALVAAVRGETDR